MSTIRWLTRNAIEIIHDEQISEHGGLPGLKDENALESSLARPQNKHAYGEDNIHVLAAAYLYGIVRKNHPFSDGNKRTGFLAAFSFLALNGYLLETAQPDAIAFVLSVAAGEIDEDGAAHFLKDFSVPYSL